jgi:hypothetical protein
VLHWSVSADYCRCVAVNVFSSWSYVVVTVRVRSILVVPTPGIPRLGHDGLLADSFHFIISRPTIRRYIDWKLKASSNDRKESNAGLLAAVRWDCHLVFSASDGSIVLGPEDRWMWGSCGMLTGRRKQNCSEKFMHHNRSHGLESSSYYKFVSWRRNCSYPEQILPACREYESVEVLALEK